MVRHLLVVLLLSACGFDAGVDQALVESGRADDGLEGPDAGPGQEPAPQEPAPQEPDAAPSEPLPPNPQPQPTCADDDGDGYDGLTAQCPMGADCDDGDGEVFPGQTGYFDVARGDGSFDYDCDAQDEPGQDSVYVGRLRDACDSYDDDDGINVVGWESVLVPCGVVGTFLYCDGEDLHSEQRVQSCR